jgi:hypothetical protein
VNGDLIPPTPLPDDRAKIDANAERINAEAAETIQYQDAEPQLDSALDAAKKRRELRDELARTAAQEAFWAVRHQNPKKQRIKGIRRALAYVRSRYVPDGTVAQDGRILSAVRIVTVARRDGLSGRQWRKLRKDLNREAKRRSEQTPVELPTARGA